MIFCCCCAGTCAGSLLSLFGIIWLLDNAEKFSKIFGIIILGFVLLFLLERFVSSIVYTIKTRIKEKERLDWESYKRHALWGILANLLA